MLPGIFKYLKVFIKKKQYDSLIYADALYRFCCCCCCCCFTLFHVHSKPYNDKGKYERLREMI